MALGQSASVAISLTATSAGTYSNVATVSADQDTNASNNVAIKPITILVSILWRTLPHDVACGNLQHRAVT